MMKKIWLLLFLALSFNAQAEETTKLIGDYGDWSAYVYKEGSDLVCFMASSPKKEEGKYTMRGDIYAVVTHRPAEKSFDVVNFVAGYNYKPKSEVVVKIGNQVFKRFFVEKDKAWTLTPEDDQTLVKAMLRGERMIVSGTSERSTATKDTYSLKGFTRAYKAINAKCSKK